VRRGDACSKLAVCLWCDVARTCPSHAHGLAGARWRLTARTFRHQWYRLLAWRRAAAVGLGVTAHCCSTARNSHCSGCLCGHCGAVPERCVGLHGHSGAKRCGGRIRGGRAARSSAIGRTCLPVAVSAACAVLQHSARLQACEVAAYLYCFSSRMFRPVCVPVHAAAGALHQRPTHSRRHQSLQPSPRPRLCRLSSQAPHQTLPLVLLLLLLLWRPLK
jgi:hypothetical protein